MKQLDEREDEDSSNHFVYHGQGSGRLQRWPEGSPRFKIQNQHMRGLTPAERAHFQHTIHSIWEKRSK
jgi:hypothetical protein